MPTITNPNLRAFQKMVYNATKVMNVNIKDLILSEDKIRLTQDQKNLIELAFIKQIPPEDAEFIEKVKKEARSSKDKMDTFTELSAYYTAKYGSEFGMVYLSAVMGGEEKYNETVASIEKMRAEERVKSQSN